VPDVEPAVEKEARASITAVVRRSLVLLTHAPQGTRSTDYGSGTLIVGPNGRVAVLTAAHIVDDRPQHSLGLVTTDRFFRDVSDGHLIAPGHVDVALVWVNADIADALRPLAMDASVIDTRDPALLGRHDLLVVAGFSEQFVHDVSVDEHVIENRFVDGVRYTYEHGHDDRKISIAWREARIRGPDFPHRLLGIDADAMTPLKKPRGVSGGPVFRVVPTVAGTIWLPSAALRLVGIAYEWNKQREHAVPYWRWASWVNEQLRA
jgi:hypothetical protein